MTSFYPAVNGRATSQLGITRLLFQINNDQSAIQSLQTQLSTGRRVTTPSQDPGAAIRALTAQRQLEFKAQIDDNLHTADSILSATESSLSQAQTILNEIRGVVVEATGSVLSEEERGAYVAQVQAAINKLAELGNAKFRDQFIFGGSDIAEQPFELFGDTVRFRGNEEELVTISDFASTVAANINAEDSFGVRSEKIVSQVDLDPSVATDTPLSILNRGSGVEGGAISLSDGVTVVELDLANSYDLNDVLVALNATAIGGRELTATLSTNGIDIQYADGLGGILRVDEVGSGVMAAGLGIRNVGTAALSPVIGADLDPVATAETRVTQLFGGTGFTLGETFRITQGEETYTVTTNGIENLEDFFNRIDRSGAQVLANIDNTGKHLSIQTIESGTTLQIGENGGTLASLLGIRTFDLNTSISDLNHGQGIYASDTANDLVLTRTDGSDMVVDLDGVQNISDVLDRINNHVDNFNPATRVLATLSSSGNGIVLTAPTGAQEIAIKNFGGSQAAWGLGLVAHGEIEQVGSASGGNSVITGLDVSGVEVEGMFTSLIRLRQAIESENPESMARISDLIEDDVQRLSLARGLVGTRQQSIEQTEDLSTNQQLMLKQIESDELDSDLAEVISELASREAALQASLQLMSQTTRLTLFDYI